ncbi:MAG: stage sporulation protein [Gaiellaceae bacterium]|nr:stage sporulation protein [Gaiellaceae bacterium]
MLRRTVLAAATLSLVVPASALADVAPTVSATTFVLSGHGWGHGIGMAQYGAYGYAQHGWGYKQIVGHYFRGTTLGQARPTTLRVLLAEKQKSVAIGSTSAFKVRDGVGALHTVNLLSVPVGTGLRVGVDGQPFRTTLPGPLTFLPAGAPLTIAGRAYRGNLQVVAAGKVVSVIDRVGLEAYVRGVVASEMPHDWAPEALKAQAVATRSYGLAVRHTTGPFDLYGDTRSQVYGGIAAETPESDAAVAATARQIVLYQGKVATTFFYSSSGGQTAAIQDVWNSPPIPYLASEADPYDTISPYHDWGPLVFTAPTVAKKLKVTGPVLDLQAQSTGSQRVSSVGIVTPGGMEQSVGGSTVRTALGLRSTWFTVGTLSLTRPTPNLLYGSGLTLTGMARGVTAPVLESKVGSAAWQQVQALAPSADGSFSLSLQPSVITFYRITAGKTSGATLRVPVASVVTLSPAAAGLAGAVTPAQPDAPVELQQLTGTTWTVVASGVTGADGSFSFAQPAAGSYRARVVTGRGFVPGLSEPLTVG